MIPMTCPSCGRHGRAPSGRARMRMSCKKCGVIFHLDEEGKVVLGDPEQLERAERAKEAHQPDLNLINIFRKAPAPVQFLSIVGALILLPFAMGYRIDLHPPPRDREARFEYLARAFLSNSADAVEKVSAPGTAPSAGPWLAAIRSKFQLKDSDIDPTLTLESIVVSETESSGRIQVVLHLSNMAIKSPLPASTRSSPMIAGTNADGSLDVPTVWILAGKELWSFDPTQSLEWLTLWSS